MIELKNIFLSYSDKPLLNNFSYEFKKNAIYLLLGKSGSGKTSLLKLCADLEKNYQGTITINKKNINHYQNSEYSQLVHFVFQNYVLFNHLSVLENIIFFTSLVDNKDRKELEKKADYFLDYFSLSSSKHSTIETLSGGEKQRIALIRSFIKDPSVFLFDEPTSALDKNNTDLLINLILKIKNEEKVVIISSQDQYFIKEISENSTTLSF